MADAGTQVDKTSEEEAAMLFSCLTEKNQVEFLRFMRALVAQNQNNKLMKHN